MITRQSIQNDDGNSNNNNCPSPSSSSPSPSSSSQSSSLSTSCEAYVSRPRAASAAHNVIVVGIIAHNPSSLRQTTCCRAVPARRLTLSSPPVSSLSSSSSLMISSSAATTAAAAGNGGGRHHHHPPLIQDNPPMPLPSPGGNNNNNNNRSDNNSSSRSLSSGDISRHNNYRLDHVSHHHHVAVATPTGTSLLSQRNSRLSQRCITVLSIVMGFLILFNIDSIVALAFLSPSRTYSHGGGRFHPLAATKRLLSYYYDTTNHTTFTTPSPTSQQQQQLDDDDDDDATRHQTPGDAVVIVPDRLQAISDFFSSLTISSTPVPPDINSSSSNINVTLSVAPSKPQTPPVPPPAASAAAAPNDDTKPSPSKVLSPEPVAVAVRSVQEGDDDGGGGGGGIDPFESLFNNPVDDDDDDPFWHHHNSVDEGGGGHQDGISSRRPFHTAPFASYSFTISGRFLSIAVPIGEAASPSNIVTNWQEGILFDEGTVRVVILTRQSSIQSVRLASVRLDFMSERFPYKSRQFVQMTGLDLRDTSSLTLQGQTMSSVFDSPSSSGLTAYNSTAFLAPAQPRKCGLLATLAFDGYIGESLSARAIELEQEGSSDQWGFDSASFGEAGEWERRLLSRVMESAEKKGQAEQHDDDENNNEEKPIAAPRPETGNSSSSGNKLKDLKGVLLSPDCGFRIMISGNEVNLVSLGARVVHFSCFFILRSLLEARFFLAQARYSDDSSPQKVSVLSLGLHTCIDCFEAILLLTEAVAANFMTSTFVILAIFKMMFVSVLELRYLVIVLKARYNEAATTEELPRLVKLHALGTAFMLISTLKMMPIFPLAVAGLYLFWVPQIIFDVWDGSRRSLSLQYVIGMSACRLFLPLYLWGCPSAIFDGVIFKSLPGAPSLMISLVILFLVLAQVAIVVAQHFLGPRCFVPMILLPNVYNYYRPVSKPPSSDNNADPGGLECVICMTEVSYVSKTLVTTPCDHRFHVTCLQQWMDVKAECPTCRRRLPPFA